MKLTKNLIVAALLWAVCGSSGEQEHTGLWLNCRGWRNILGAKDKQVYTMGLIEGISAGLSELSADRVDPHGEQVSRLFFADHFTNYDEFYRGIEGVCGQPENAVLPVPWALQIFVLKANGKPQSDINKRASELRALSSALAASPEK